MSITLEEVGARVYVVGNSYPIKAAIKAAGGHWDADRRQWWVGKMKREAMEQAIAKASEKADEVSDDTKVLGQVEYKGKTYYLIAKTRDGSSYKLCSKDKQLVFWAKAENGAKVVKTYGHRRGFRGYGSQHRANDIEYPTIGGLRRFAERVKKDEANPNAERRQCWECGGWFLRHEVEEWNSHSGKCYCGC